VELGGWSTAPEMEAFARLPHLTHLHIDSYASTWIRLTPLLLSCTLETLIMNTRVYFNFTDANIDEVRLFGHLQKMSFPQLQNDVAYMTRLLAPPHTLQWKEIGIIHSSTCSALLVHLPSLTALEGFSFSFAPHTIRALPHITRANLEEQDGLHTVLAQFSHLMHLVVHDIVTLEWAHIPSLCTSLQTVEIERGWAVNKLCADELNHLANLKALRTLILHRNAFDDDVETSPSFSALSPPSSVIPSLMTVIVK
jgi:hypothetical protein